MRSGSSDDLRERFAKFNLELHPDKTRLIEFGRFAAKHRTERGLKKPETFDFLGFTHICGKTRDGRFWLRRVTIKKRLRAKLKRVKTELEATPAPARPRTGAWLASVVRGHLAYYAVPGNIDAVAELPRPGEAAYWCGRFGAEASAAPDLGADEPPRARWLPPARIVHPYPSVRFAARTRGRSPVRRLLARRCELCGDPGQVAVHQVRKLASLEKHTGPPAWVALMLRKRRKTLVVCHPCHDAIHDGKPTAQTA